jgi:putative restriction endonuclease
VKAYVAVTDREWFDFLRRQPGLSEVNFWQPRGGTAFHALEPGQPLLFKLRFPEHAIVGGGFFATFSILPVSLAWEAFGIQNGAASLLELRARIEHIRSEGQDSHQDYAIGCIILSDPFFLDRSDWIPAPADFAKEIVRGKGYDLRLEPGAGLWTTVVAARARGQHRIMEPAPARMYGDPALFLPRLGQGAFRVVVTDAYDRRCALTGERTLPVLEAAHIRPVARGGQHRVDNGLLFRSDIHRLFDLGYATVTPDLKFRVSRRIREDWQNGRDYYALDDHPIRRPIAGEAMPDRLALEWHSDNVFLC